MPRFELPSDGPYRPVADPLEMDDPRDPPDNPDADLFEPSLTADELEAEVAGAADPSSPPAVQHTPPAPEPDPQCTPIVCPHCGHNEFEISGAMLNTPGMTFLRLDWLNRTASVLVCTTCSHIQWFMEQPEEMS